LQILWRKEINKRIHSLIHVKEEEGKELTDYTGLST
jgi:hypothetical protein